MKNKTLHILKEAIDSQERLVDCWRQPSEPLLFETLRAIDNVFMQELFIAIDSSERLPLPLYALSTWGVNQALARMIPDALTHGPFRLFPSTAVTQAPADRLIMQSGILERAHILYGWLEEDLLTGRLDTIDQRHKSGIKDILVLRSEDPSLNCELIGRKHREWMSEIVMEFDRENERRLQSQHAEILPELKKRVKVFQGWGISYSTTTTIDQHFLECGQIYLRRMWSQDLLDLEDKLGDNQFNEYLGVLAALAGRAEKHHCFSQIIKHRHPHLDLRNLLTTFSPYDEFVIALANHLDADRLQIEKLLKCLTLEPENRDIHTKSTDTVWAPIVRSSLSTCILPLFGMEINPFLFLLKDLRTRYPKDWFEAANNRERRWIDDLKHIFSSERWKVRDGNLTLRDGKRAVTDLDFVAYDSRNNELGLFQLKWQHPVGIDNRARRSAGRNLVSQGNKWTEAVHGWIGVHGMEELARRAQIKFRPGVTGQLFVIARYNAFFSGFGTQDDRAIWADWNHLVKARMGNPEASLTQLAEILRKQIARMIASLDRESYALPMGSLAVILNPTHEPKSSA